MITSIPSYVKLALIALLSITAMLITSQATHAAGTDDFVITVQSDNYGNGTDTEYVVRRFGSGYNYNIDCDDDGVDEGTGITGEFTCDYTTSSSGAGAGLYTIRIEDNTGANTGFPQVFNGPGAGGVANDTKLRTVEQWGTIQWSSFDNAFYEVDDLVINDPLAPDLSGVTNMSNAFAGSDNFNSDINHWDTSTIVDMEGVFSGASSFNQPLNNWNLVNVSNASRMFERASDFNQPIGNWDVGNVTTMEAMFSGAHSFNQPIDMWDVSNVTIMQLMFALGLDAVDGDGFNQPLNSWDVSSVTAMSNMFAGMPTVAEHPFNQPLDNWDVSSVVYMQGMFSASDFNQPVNGWGVGSVEQMNSMFAYSDFNQPLDNWDVSSVTTMAGMFQYTDFSQDITGWNTSSVTNFDFMFRFNPVFNQDISVWDTSSLLDMRNIFQGATAFNQDISSWDTSRVSTFWSVFEGATSFNQDISSWDTSSLVTAIETFKDATSFNQDISTWDMSGVIDATAMFEGATAFDQDLSAWDISGIQFNNATYQGAGSFLANNQISNDNYTSTLVSWASQTLNSGVVFDAGNSQYCTDGHAARETLINTYTWTVTDGGPGECIDIFLDLSSSPADTTTTTPNATYTITFSEPIDPTTFTLADITLSGTTTASIDSLTEGAPNDGTTFELQISNLVLDEEVTIEIANSTTNNSVGVSNQAVLGTLTYTQDSDNDGIPDTEEQIAFNGGDANNDGTPDYLQPTVTTIMNEDGTHSTLEVDTCSQISMFATRQESDLAQQNQEFDFPLGLSSFNLECAAGDSTNITLYINTDQQIDNLYRYSESNAELSLIEDASFTTQDISGTSMQILGYEITDGSNADADSEVNGSISDLVGFALGTSTTQAAEELAETGVDTIHHIVFGTIFALTPAIIGLVHKQWEQVRAGL